MGDGNDKPKLQPPPRVPVVSTADPGADSSRGRRSPSPARPAARAAVSAAMVLGL